jgi:16S rRNA (cytosine1402-N4)-methyltransferase
VLETLGIDGLDGAMLDLGVSSHQLDEGERGFSYRFSAPLDMRMDRRQELTAYTVVNTYSEQDLTRVISDYGEEKFARAIARRIVQARAIAPIETTDALADLILSAFPAAARRNATGHPAKRTFQALRIDVNSEFEVLYAFLEKLPTVLAPNGRVAILTFHSGEDRLVKRSFKELQKMGIYSEVSKDVIRPSAEECVRNGRAKCTKMRWAVRSEMEI